MHRIVTVIVDSNSIHTITFTFRKVMNPLFPLQMWYKLNYYCFSTRMALAFNMFNMLLNQETKLFLLL